MQWSVPKKRLIPGRYTLFRPPPIFYFYRHSTRLGFYHCRFSAEQMKTQSFHSSGHYKEARAMNAQLYSPAAADGQARVRDGI